MPKRSTRPIHQQFTDAQLIRGAAAIAYRAEQLGGVATMIAMRASVGGPDPRLVVTVRNSLVESGLVCARTLARFFMTGTANVNTSMFVTSWNDAVISVAPDIWHTISRYLDHVSVGTPEGDLHPGDWPIPELAMTLTGGLSRFIGMLEDSITVRMAAWFQPNPGEIHARLMRTNPLAVPTVKSANVNVAALTRSLQSHLQGQ